ncbi:hypothetical protein [Fluviicola taffensis]|uniref:hypothetical protein n=1 Tax=Fluviicola taffensis TaxID=191579 RepID=UPI0031382E90
MNIQFLLVFSFFSTLSVSAQSNSQESILPDSLCYKLWWVDNKMGGYDGYEFRSNGELKLLNYDAFVGEKWWIKGEHLFTEIRSKRDGKILKTDYLIKKQTANSMVLNYVALDQSFTDTYESITNNDFTDKLLGHWQGEGESYIQVVPMSSFRFQLVLSKNKAESVERVEGFLDERNSRIIFYLEMDGKELTIYFEAGKETISIAGKTYSRKC